MRLSAILDLPAASRLRDDLIQARGTPLELDASAVDRLGGPCLQVLLAAQAAWRADKASFRIVNPSEAFQRSVRIMAANGLINGESAV